MTQRAIYYLTYILKEPSVSYNTHFDKIHNS